MFQASGSGGYRAYNLHRVLIYTLSILC